MEKSTIKTFPTTVLRMDAIFSKERLKTFTRVCLRKSTVD